MDTITSSLYAAVNEYPSIFKAPLTLFISPFIPLLKYKSDDDVLTSACWLVLIAIFLSYFASNLTGNWSQVDRIWSVLPVVYVWHFVIYSGSFLSNTRATLMAFLVSIWGLRLSYNYYRKGGYYSGHEDYRWTQFRSKHGPVFNQLFLIFFVEIFQNILIFLFTLPIYTAVKNPTDLVGWDYFLIFVWIALLFLEHSADELQWNFQKTKHELIKNHEPLNGVFRDGFLQEHLFSNSRHPNFFAEISMWWVYWLITCVMPLKYGMQILPMAVGPIFLTILFHFSTNFTEELSLKKYPRYADYQKRVSRWFPWPASTNHHY